MCAPSMASTELGRIDTVVERLYAITTEGKLTRPAILAIQQAARRELFAKRPRRRPCSDRPHLRPHERAPDHQLPRASPQRNTQESSPT